MRKVVRKWVATALMPVPQVQIASSPTSRCLALARVLAYAPVAKHLPGDVANVIQDIPEARANLIVQTSQSMAAVRWMMIVQLESLVTWSPEPVPSEPAPIHGFVIQDIPEVRVNLIVQISQSMAAVRWMMIVQLESLVTWSPEPVPSEPALDSWL